MIGGISDVRIWHISKSDGQAVQAKALRAYFSVIAHLLVFKERTLRNHEDPRPRQASSKVPKIPTDPISALFKASNVRIDDAARYSLEQLHYG